MTAQIFIKVDRLFEDAPTFFIGGNYPTYKEAEADVAKVRALGYEVVYPEEQPQNIENAIRIEILPQTMARRSGLRSPKMFGAKDKKNTLLSSKLIDAFTKKLDKIDVLRPYTRQGERQETYDTTEELSEMISQLNSNSQNVQPRLTNVIIVSRFPATEEWLKTQGITGISVKHASPEIVKGNIVIGVIPLRLAATAKVIGNIDMPFLQPDQRGQALSAEEMAQAGARVRWYKVTEVVPDTE